GGPLGPGAGARRERRRRHRRLRSCSRGARAGVDRARRARRRGSPPGVTPGPDLERVVATYLDHLTVERGLSVNTLSSYRRDLRRYVAVLSARGIERMEQVTETDVSEFLAALRRGDDEHPPLRASSAARAVVAARGLH